MGSESHSEGALVDEFCTQRTATCSPCGSKYASCVTDNPALAVSFKFPRFVDADGGQTQDISQNAHHLLCVAEVTKVMSKDGDLLRVLQKTVYCINKAPNMIALPLFAHTVYWYCLDDKEAKDARQKIGSVITSLTPPPFANLTNHDFDHGKYNKEVETLLGRLNGQVKTAEHKLAPGQLSVGLNALSADMRTALQVRGSARKGGTHAAWVAACNENQDEWYLPFSLADDPAERGFPGKLNSNLARLKKAIDFLLGT